MRRLVTAAVLGAVVAAGSLGFAAPGLAGPAGAAGVVVAGVGFAGTAGADGVVVAGVGFAGTAAAAGFGFALEDNTEEVCVTSAKTVDDGLDKFVAEMRKVGDTAGTGDLVAAEQSVKKAGAELVTLADGLRTDAATATAPKVKTTLGDLADEFEAQGEALTDLTALQGFDVKRIEELADEMSALCGAPTPAPLPTRSVAPTR